MCQWGANRNTGAGYRMSSSRSPRGPNRGVEIGDHRLSTSCGVVERHHRLCGDDLVSVARAMLLKKTKVSTEYIPKSAVRGEHTGHPATDKTKRQREFVLRKA